MTDAKTFSLSEQILQEWPFTFYCYSKPLLLCWNIHMTVPFPTWGKLTGVLRGT